MKSYSIEEYENSFFKLVKIDSEVKLIDNAEKGIVSFASDPINIKRAGEQKNIWPENPGDQDSLKWLNAVKGHYAGGFLNIKKRELNLINDYFGTKPLYVYDSGDYFCFSSVLEPILLLKEFKASLNEDAIAEYFTLGAVLGEKTFLKGVNNLPAGSWLTVYQDSFELCDYRDMQKSYDLSMGLDEASEALHSKLRNAVRDSQELYNVNYGGLTGGADTRLMLALMDPERRKDFLFKTEGNNPFHKNGNLDVLGASELAKRFNLRHEIIDISFVDSAEANTGKIHMPEENVFRYDNYPEKNFQGKFATEFIGGTVFELLNYDLMKHDIGAFDSGLAGLFDKNFLAAMSDPYERLVNALEEYPAVSREYQFGVRSFLRSFYSKNYAPYDWAWISPSYFINSGCVSPFIDKELLQFMLGMPREYIMNYNLYGAVYRNFLGEYLQVPFHSLIADKVHGFKKMTSPKSVYVAPNLAFKNKAAIQRPRHIVFAEHNRDHFILNNMDVFNRDYVGHKIDAGDKDFCIKYSNFILWFDHYLKDSLF